MSTAITAAEFETHTPTANEDESRPLPLRGDTFLGVFEAIGQDFGFNPNWLRIPFGAAILWNPAVIIGSYLGLGLLVALSRWLYPAKPKSAAPALVSEAPAAAEVQAEEVKAEQKDEELAVAA